MTEFAPPRPISIRTIEAGTTAARSPKARPTEARSRQSVESDRPVRSPRAPAAQGSKIAAAGFGFAALFGLVGAMGFANRPSATTPPTPVENVPPAQVVVVIHPSDGTTDPAPAVSGSPVAVATTPAQPVVLTAQPTVQQAPASPAPAGQTNGSR
jgi:hypothetical protein